ncbi:hypothetical protein DPMN_059693 [Dreissena polymorpha]|uniref:Secreted protein n=1 Tax=Dreissena polymorpha TaxID=45954 RepID=A0A9D4HGV3_DREPO|nr:hypothetical protein DPMN_059693 [Dreissena polymorpha]
MLHFGLALWAALACVPGGCAMELTRMETVATCELETCGRMRSVATVSWGWVAVQNARAFHEFLRLTHTA